MKNYKVFILFWLSQSISQLGSAMTSFLLVLWTYEQNRSAMSVSLMSFCNYVPYILLSLFAGTFIDRHSKKAIMLISDSIAALCTLAVLVLAVSGRLEVWNIYAVNVVIGFMNAFQQPASAVAVGKMVPKEKLVNVSGMNSFSSNLVNVLTPVIAAFIYSFGGLETILLIDIISFLFAFFVLLFAVHISEEYEYKEKTSVLSGTVSGFRFLKKEKGLLFIMITLAMINFFSRLTYENILSPMILSRSGSSVTLGVVNAVMGIGGIVGGIIVSAGKASKNNIKMIYVSAAVSFLSGDLLMAVGRNSVMWSLAAFAASFPIAFIIAGQNVILYDRVPEEMQGRVFAVRNAIQFSTIPLGILLGGFLADYVFEPFMRSDNLLSNALSVIVGGGEGSGMAVMFLCTGISGSVISVLSYRSKEIQKLK
ncbi:MAG: MFS transporter [Ruminococcus sp.]|nr:MFS transporter [Ruminococcus sp.]